MKTHTVKLLLWLLAVTAALAGGYLLGRSGSGTRTEQAHPAAATAADETAWTCSMHPQVKLPEPGQCPVCFMDLIPLDENTDGTAAPRQLTMTESAAELAEIVTVPVERKKVYREVRAAGFVRYDETRLKTITARVAGRIEKMHADFTGARVAAGQELFVIYSPELYAAQEEYLQAATGGNDVLLRAAREKLSLWELTDSQVAALEQRGTAVPHITYHSPLAGVVITRHVTEGTYVSTGTPVYTVADLNTVWIELDAYETDLPWIRTGQQAAFTVRAVPGRTFNGRVTFIDPVLDTGTRTAGVRIAVDNRSRRLKPGMFVSARIESGIRENSGRGPLVIPASAPLLTGKRAVAYVRVPGTGPPAYEGRDITLGPRAGDYYVVQAGLREGERVVVHGAFKIDAALQIRAETSMMLPAAAAAHSRMPTVPPGFVHSLQPLYDAYFKAQAALAGDDRSAAAGHLQAMTPALGRIRETLLSGAAGAAWKTQKQSLTTVLAKAAHATTIDGVRTLFRDISVTMIDIQKRFGHTGTAPHYITFCPMAFGNRGGSWLQNHGTVDNPYYGAAMLRCGEIKETIESN